MEPAILPAAQGWLWVLQGFGIFRRYAALWLLLLFFYWTGLLALSAVPLLGPVLSMLLMPGVSAGMMVACKSASAQHLPPTLRHFYEPFARNRNAQLKLGLLNLAGTAVAIGISSLFSDGQVMQNPPASMDRAQMMRAMPGYFQGAAAFFIAFSPVMVALWFAPALVHWRGMAPGKAVFFSFFAFLRNWRAFTVYGLGWIFFLSIVPAFLMMVLAALLPIDMRGVTVVAFVLTPYVFAVLGAMACSLYPTYAAVFPQTDGGPDGRAGRAPENAPEAQSANKPAPGATTPEPGDGPPAQ